MPITMQLRAYLNSEEFKQQVVERNRRFEVLSEAGLRTTIANPLQARLTELDAQKSGYCVSCEVHLPSTNIVPDILIWRKNDPRIWIELKDTKTFDSRKARADWEKLKTSCPKYPSVKAGYLIYVARTRGDFDVKRDRATMRYWPITIVLEEHIQPFEAWNREYGERAHYKVSVRARGVRACSVGRQRFRDRLHLPCLRHLISFITADPALPRWANHFRPCGALVSARDQR
jgi:hypothetical protein